MSASEKNTLSNLSPLSRMDATKEATVRQKREDVIRKVQLYRLSKRDGQRGVELQGVFDSIDALISAITDQCPQCQQAALTAAQSTDRRDLRQKGWLAALQCEGDAVDELKASQPSTLSREQVEKALRQVVTRYHTERILERLGYTAQEIADAIR